MKFVLCQGRLVLSFSGQSGVNREEEDRSNVFGRLQSFNMILY